MHKLNLKNFNRLYNPNDFNLCTVEIKNGLFYIYLTHKDTMAFVKLILDTDEYRTFIEDFSVAHA